MLQSPPMSIDQIVTELKAERDPIDAAIKALTALTVAPRINPRVKRAMSAAGRRKIAAAQRARWAKVRQQRKPAFRAISGSKSTQPEQARQP
jgi:hypothetical protein